MKTCTHCSQPLVGRQQKFCSNRCQRRAQQADLTAKWLETGVAPYAGTGPGHYIRSYVVAEQGNCCALCGHSEEWQGAALVFVLDHIDGDASNNRRENLRLICPNCDSQLPTFKAKNWGKGRAWRRERYAEGKSY